MSHVARKSNLSAYEQKNTEQPEYPHLHFSVKSRSKPLLLQALFNFIANLCSWAGWIRNSLCFVFRELSHLYVNVDIFEAFLVFTLGLFQSHVFPNVIEYRKYPK